MRSQLLAAVALVVAAPALAAPGFHKIFEGSPPDGHVVPKGEVHKAATIALGRRVQVEGRLFLEHDQEPGSVAVLHPGSAVQVWSSRASNGGLAAQALIENPGGLHHVVLTQQPDQRVVASTVGRVEPGKTIDVRAPPLN